MASRAITLLVIGLLLSQPLVGWARPQIQVDAASGELSDQVNVNEMLVFHEADRLNSGWPYASDGEKTVGAGSWSVYGWRQQIESSVFKAALSELVLGYRYLLAPSRWWLEAHAGVHAIEAPSGIKNSTHGVGSAKVHFLDSALGLWQIKVSREFMARRIQMLAGNPANLGAESLEAIWRWQPSEKWKFNLKYHTAQLEDHNRRQSMDGQLMWGAMLFPHWIWVGVGGEDLRNSRSSIGYWSPDHFQAYGLRLDLSFSIDQDWSLFAGGSLNQLRESTQPWGRGHYVKGGVQLGNHEEALMRLFIEESHSEQSISSWESRLVGFTVQWPF